MPLHAVQCPMTDGYVNLMKPVGMTSSDAVVWLRGRLRCKTGHAGTLDPGAAGVLIICTGKATRLFDYLQGGEKEYVAGVTLGISTDTQDSYGRITKSAEVPVFSDGDIDAAVKSFVGDYEQTPSRFSAVRIGGEKAYEIARRGGDAELASRRVHIYRAEVLRRSGYSFDMRVRCSSGTYIRALAEDIGKRLGVPAYMNYLIRTECASRRIEDSLTPDEVLKSMESGADIIRPMDELLAGYPSFNVLPEYEKAIINGNPLSRDMTDAWPEGVSRAYLRGRLFALCEHREVRGEEMMAVKVLLV